MSQNRTVPTDSTGKTPDLLIKEYSIVVTNTKEHIGVVSRDAIK